MLKRARELLAPTLEFSLKNDDLGDPLINSYHVFSFRSRNSGRN